MKIRIKYWSNETTGFYVKDVFCTTLSGIRDVINIIKYDRPEINNFECYLGEKIVIYEYN